MSESNSPQFKRRWYQFSLLSLLVFMLIAILAVAWVARLRDIQQRDEQNIQGSWREVEWEYHTIVLDQGEMRSHSPFLKVGPESTNYKIDAKATPKQFDVIFDWGFGDGPETLHGIYRLSGDSLTICYPLDPDAPRPTSFEHTQSDQFVVFNLERVRDD
ncbi:MAG: TIGR03067 domain-containing protein [Planctomycetes bacterium]|nr:TIGR03067 domain-containing protein [Planctomycetota bacterium]